MEKEIGNWLRARRGNLRKGERTQMEGNYDIGLIGLAVMGQNLVLNIERNGFSVAVFNRTGSVTEEFMRARVDGKRIGAAYTFKPFSVGELTARVDWTERGENYYYPLDSINIFNEEVKDPGTENLRARIALSGMPIGDKGSWEVGIWGDNLTDHNNLGYGIDFGGLGFGGLFYTEPRRYGVDVKINF